MQKIRPCLWLDNNVQEVIDFYSSVFKSTKVLSISYYPADMPNMGGKILVAEMEIENQEFMLLNAGGQFKFNEAISFSVDANTQEEIDYYWDALLAGGGQKGQCGWLKDKFGLSWQISPSMLGELFRDKDTAKAHRAMDAMMKMVKINIKEIEEAVKG